MASKEFVNIDELTALIQDDEFLNIIKHEDHNHINIAILPSDDNEITDFEDIRENDLNENRVVNDISGYFELFVPQLEQIEQMDMFSNPTTAKQAKKDQKLMAKNKKEEELKWEEMEPIYNRTATPSKDKTEVVRRRLEQMSAIEIFECMFSDEIFQLIIAQSELYARQNNDTKFSLNLADLKKFIGILLFSGYGRLPHETSYWEHTTTVRVSIVCDAMSRSRFCEIKRYFHLNDNSAIVKPDKFYKLRKFFNILKKNFLQFGVFSSMLSVDELMVPFYGKHLVKANKNSTAITLGYKIWCLCNSNGYLYNFEPYEGNSGNINESQLGDKVVKSLINVIPVDSTEDYEVFFDSFFTSHELLKDLGEIKLKATGTILEDRTNNCPIMTLNSQRNREQRGYYEKVFDKENEILMVKWKNTKFVEIASNYSDVLPLINVRRYSITDKQYVTVPTPRLVSEYNKNVGGVALLNNQVSFYRTRIRSKKWWWPLFTQFLEIAVANAWQLYQIAHPTEKVSLLDVRRQIIYGYLLRHGRRGV